MQTSLIFTVCDIRCACLSEDTTSASDTKPVFLFSSIIVLFFSHIDFIKSAAFLFASTMNVKVEKSEMSTEHLLSLLGDLQVPPFVPKNKVRVPAK